MISDDAISVNTFIDEYICKLITIRTNDLKY